MLVLLYRPSVSNEKILREALAAERAQLMAEVSAQKDALISEKDGRITTLEDELARVRAELEEEWQQRGIEDSDIREGEETDRSSLNVMRILEHSWATHELCSGPTRRESQEGRLFLVSLYFFLFLFDFFFFWQVYR